MSPPAEAPATLAPAPTAATLDGRWTVTLQNVLDTGAGTVVVLRLQLRQRGATVSGDARASIESTSMTFSVGEAPVAGSWRPAATTPLRLSIPFEGRPLGELRLEGTVTAGGMAGTFQSSLGGSKGTWQATRP
jgi:hypothetical protein